MNKILAIDDNRDNLITVTALLKSFLKECVVETALSGSEGIEKAKNYQPDVILLDIKMPGMDGYEVCSTLKKDIDTLHIPVILLTALKTDTESRIKGLEIGADAFLTKPIDETELIAQIKVMLRIKKAEDLLRKEKSLLEEMVNERTIELVESRQNLMKERDFIRSLEDASPAYYFAIDASLSIIAMNRSLLEVMGRTSKEVIGINFLTSCVPDAEKEQVAKNIENLLKNKKEASYEFHVVARKGNEILVEWHGRPMFSIDGKLDFLFFVGVDITERIRLEKIVLNSSEMERHKIGQDLHELVGQNLAAMSFKSELVRLKLKDMNYSDLAEIDSLGNMVNDAIARVRDLARNLCPVDMAAGGLSTALEELKAATIKNKKVSCLIDVDEEQANLSDLEASNLYYIAREALENSLTHGKAKNIVISLKSHEKNIVFKIIDDGVGIPETFEQSAGVGIGIMRYRSWIIGSTFTIKKIPGGGTDIECFLRRHEDSRAVDAFEFQGEKYLSPAIQEKAGILIVDDHPIVREGLTKIINREKDMCVIGEACNAEETLKNVARLNPHLVIADISVDGASGLDIIKALKSRFPGLPVLVLSIYDESIYAERALRCGARGYIMKQEAPQAVVGAIRTVLDGKQYLSPKARERIIERIPYGDRGSERSPVDSLTIRELEVFHCIGHGLSNKNIAEKLHVSVKTIENYRERIKNKLNLESSSDTMKYAVQWVIDQNKQYAPKE